MRVGDFINDVTGQKKVIPDNTFKSKTQMKHVSVHLFYNPHVNVHLSIKSNI